MLPPAVVQNTPRQVPSDSTIFGRGNRVVGMTGFCSATVNHQWLWHGRPLAGHLTQRFTFN